MKVISLIHISTPQSFDNCMLMLRSARVGFPDSEIEVSINPTPALAGYCHILRELTDLKGIKLTWNMEVVHHAEWIKDRVEEHDGALVIVDPDVHFWKSVENWKFSSLLAGYLIPELWNDATQCRSVSRLHTSLLWINDTVALRAKIKELYPLCHDQRAAPFCPCDPYTPAVKFFQGEPIFWDTCAQLYHMVGGTHFSKEHWDCYDHLSSASFYDLINEYLGKNENPLWTWTHTEGAKNLEVLRRLSWPMTEAYIAEKVAQGKSIKRKILDV